MTLFFDIEVMLSMNHSSGQAQVADHQRDKSRSKSAPVFCSSHPPQLQTDAALCSGHAAETGPKIGASPASLYDKKLPFAERSRTCSVGLCFGSMEISLESADVI